MTEIMIIYFSLTRAISVQRIVSGQGQAIDLTPESNEKTT